MDFDAMTLPEMDDTLRRLRAMLADPAWSAHVATIRGAIRDAESRRDAAAFASESSYFATNSR